MAYRITHIKVSDNYATSTDKITHIKLDDGRVESVAEVVRYLDQNIVYYYTTSTFSKALVESVHPSYGQAYIRTIRNGTEKDNLLNLPKF